MAEIQVLHTLKAETASGTGPAVQLPLGSAVGYYLTVSALAGTSPSIIVKIDYSVDGVNWVPGWVTINSTARTAVGSDGAYVSIPGVMIRANWTIAGTTPSVTFSVVAVGQTTAIAN